MTTREPISDAKAREFLLPSSSWGSHPFLHSGYREEPPDVVPKLRNLPVTTRELISNAKARESLLPSSSWGSHHYQHSAYREEPWVLDYIAYIGSVHEKKNF